MESHQSQWKTILISSTHTDMHGCEAIAVTKYNNNNNFIYIAPLKTGFTNMPTDRRTGAAVAQWGKRAVLQP